MIIQKLILPNGKQLLFIGNCVYQRWRDDKEWERIDDRILEHTPLPQSSQVEQIIV